MDTLHKKQTVTISRRVLSDTQECAYSADYMLPEYCPDVAVVLKCVATPRVHSRRWSGEQLQVEGVVALRVLYLDEERRCLRVAELSQPFSCTVRVDMPCDGMPAAVELTPKFVNCRAVSPRRLEIRGAFLVQAAACGTAALEMPAFSDDPQLFVRCEEMPLTALHATAEKQLTVTESVDLPHDLPPAEMLLGGDCRAVVRECRLLAGKAIVKGEVCCHYLYTDDTAQGGVYTLDFSLPYSQILDVDGAEEGVPHEAWVSVVADTAHPSVGPDGRNTVLEVGVKLLVQVCLYEPCSLPLVLDAYHSRYPVTLKTGDLSLMAPLGCSRQTAAVTLQVPLPAELPQELADVWVQAYPPVCRCHEGTVTLAGRLPVGLLVRDGDGMLSWLERTEDYSLEYPCIGNEAQGDVQILETRYRVVDGKLELHLTLAVTVYPDRRLMCRPVCEAALQTENPYPADRAAVKLYYAEAGESLWEIGRSCHASASAIAAENGLQADRLEQAGVLVIPL